MPDMPGSGPPDPDSSERVAEILAALRGGEALPGLVVSIPVARAMLGGTVSRNTITVGGVPHLVYEAFGVAFLSPSVT